jgi:hypothetical protein
MDGHFIPKRDHSQVTAFKFRDVSPKPEAIFFLPLASDRIIQNTLAPFLSYVWPLPHHLFFEVLRE